MTPTLAFFAGLVSGAAIATFISSFFICILVKREEKKRNEIINHKNNTENGSKF